ncbi:Helicase [Gammaproteobacteria bacterium]
MGINYASLWGQVFEIAVKRGILTAVLGSGLKKTNNLGLERWEELSVIHVYKALEDACKETDQNKRLQTRETARHLFVLGMGLGQTILREYLNRISKKIEIKDYAIQFLWSPLQLPDSNTEENFLSKKELLLKAFQSAFSFEFPEEIWMQKGYSANSDFLLLLEPNHETFARELLCVEISLNGLPETADYTKISAHLEEIDRYARYVDKRSVFSKICSEMPEGTFHFSEGLKEHLPAFTTRDKPFHKLCQAASYIETTIGVLKQKSWHDRSCNARAISVTQNGIESLSAKFYSSGQKDPRCELISRLGIAYRAMEKLDPKEVEQDLKDRVASAFKAIRMSLPKPIRKILRGMPNLPAPGERIAIDFSEEVEGLINPAHLLSVQEATENVGGITLNIRESFQKSLLEKERNGFISLRDVHASAIMAGIHTAKKGEIKVLGLEGNPGIGKTTAVIQCLQKTEEGFLFLYISPRVIINNDVTNHLAYRKDKIPSRILTINTNSKLIRATKIWCETQVRNGTSLVQKVDSAVFIAGVQNLKYPKNSIKVVVDQSEKEELEDKYPGSGYNKRAETDREDRIEDEWQPQVYRTLATAARDLLGVNPEINQVALTMATQGYRTVSNEKSTFDSFSYLFKNSITAGSGKEGISERREFSKRISTIIVMIDEITGDSAGVPATNNIAKWLRQQFIKPFSENPLFRVILILSDASLINEVVLTNHIEGGNRAPEKILVSNSIGKIPFLMKETTLKINKVQSPALHIMTNSYPSSSLQIDYRVRMSPVQLNQKNGILQTVWSAIRNKQSDDSTDYALIEIHRASKEGADQILFFAQDKRFLRILEERLVAREKISENSYRQLFLPSQVAIIDSSVSANERQELISERRDVIKVFLMTSSGARGISFPKADWIIALLPRFSIASSLMEIAQFIYRGRGTHYLGDDGVRREDGDHKKRRLVLVLQDFILQDQDERQWLRRISDLLTFLVIIRATIYTRVTGDAGLENKNLSIVPVGSVGSNEFVSLMGDPVREFLKEHTVFIRDRKNKQDHCNILVRVAEGISECFSGYSLESVSHQQKSNSIFCIETMQDFSIRASAENAPLLPNPREDSRALIPENLYCLGPFWLEKWVGTKKTERFRFEGWSTDIDGKVWRLSSDLRKIYENAAFPNTLRQSAEALYRILIRDKKSARQGYSTSKEISSDVWIVVPVDYARFWKPDENGNMPILSEEENWADSLGACLSEARKVLPIIPHYRDIPYAAVVGVPDPARLDWVFDDRYLAASDELNLLNVLLFG